MSKILLGEASEYAVPLPTWGLLIAAKDTIQINALDLSVRLSYHARNFIPVPPFLINAVSDVIENKEGDAGKLLVNCVKEMKKIDEDHKDDNEFKNKAMDKVKEIIH